MDPGPITSLSLKNPQCINHGIYYDNEGAGNWFTSDGAQRTPGTGLEFDVNTCSYGTWDNPIIEDDVEDDEFDVGDGECNTYCTSIYVNELVSHDTDYDFVELYNDHDVCCDLSGWEVTDKAVVNNYGENNIIPDDVTIPAKGFLVVKADDTEPLEWDGTYLSVPWKLGGSSDYARIFNSAEELIDSFRYTGGHPCGGGETYQRLTDGGDWPEDTEVGDDGYGVLTVSSDDSAICAPSTEGFTNNVSLSRKTKQLSPLENQLFTDEVVNILNQLNIIIEENFDSNEVNQELIQRVQNILPINAIKSKVKSNIKRLSYANKLQNNSAKRTIAPEIERDLCGVCNGNIVDCMVDGAVWDPAVCGYDVENINENNDISWIDCNGDCFGTAIVDDCGQCCEGNTNRVCNDIIACNASEHPRTEHPNLDCNCDCYDATPILNSPQEGEVYPEIPNSAYDVFQDSGIYNCCTEEEKNNYYPDYENDNLGCGQILGPDGLTYINVDPIKVCNDTEPVMYNGVRYVNNSEDMDCQCPVDQPVDACGVCGGTNDCVGCKDETALNYCEECTIDCNDSFFDCCVYSDPTSSGQSFQIFSTRLETYYDKPTDEAVCVTFENPNGTDIGLPEPYFIHGAVESGTQYCMELSYSYYDNGSIFGANDNTYGYFDGEWEAIIPDSGYYISITCCLDPDQENLDEWLMTNHGPESSEPDIEDRLPTLLEEYGKTEFPTQIINAPFNQNTLFNESIVSYIYHQGQSILVKDISEYIYTQDPVAYCNGNGVEKLLDCFEQGVLDDIKLNLTDSESLKYQIAWENNGNKIIATWIGPQFCQFISCDEVNTNYQVLNLNTAETGVSGEISSGQGISIRFLPPSFDGIYYYKLIY